jgi:hypothetical protein
VLFRQGVKVARRDAAVERVAKFCDPGVVEVVKNAGVHTGPVVYRHGIFSQGSAFFIILIYFTGL